MFSVPFWGYLNLLYLVTVTILTWQRFWSRCGNVILKLWTKLIESLVKIGRPFFSDRFLNLKFCTLNVRKYSYRHYIVIKFAYYILKSICNKKICKKCGSVSLISIIFPFCIIIASQA